MHPFVHVFGRTLGSYGIMMVLGALAGALYLWIYCKVRKLDFEPLIDTGLIAIVGGLAGAFLIRPLMKLPEVIIHWKSVYALMPAGQFFSYMFGEMVFYGGLIGGAIAGLIFLRYIKYPRLKAADILICAVPLAHVFGRIGCLLGGCCYGMEVPAGTFLSVIYPEGAITDVPTGVPVLGVPIIEAIVNAVIFVVLLLFLRRQKVRGLTFSLYMILYAVQRFMLEFFRGDRVRGIYGGLSTSQIISIILFALGVFLMIYLPIRQKRKQARKSASVA